MSHRLSQNARHTQDLLEELERDKELDVLRGYLVRLELFPRQRDPVAAPIRFEELKELAKHWNLHRQRHFWKTNGTKDELVRTLYRHINTKLLPLEEHEMKTESGSSSGASATSSSAVLTPVPPSRPNSGVPPDMLSKRATVPLTSSTRELSSEHVGIGYSGDLFGQRGTYEDGMIYLSRFRKPSRVLHARESWDTVSSDQGTDARVPVHARHAFDDDIQDASGPRLDLSAGTSREIQLKQECAFSIYHFSTIAGHEKQMVTEGCMVALGKLAGVDDVEVKRFCAAAVLNLLCESSLGSQMADEGVLVAALELAKAQHEEVRRHTSMALCRFSYEPTGQVRLVQEGCVSAIVSMLNVPDVETKEACVKTLINIASSTSMTVSETVVHVLLKLATRTDERSVKFAAKAIANLSLLSASRAKIVDDGVLDTVCYLVQQSRGFVATEDQDGGVVGTIQKHVATALCNLSGLATNLERLGHARILECLGDLLECEKPRQVRELCAVTIANLSSYAPLLQKVALSNAVASLVAIAMEQPSGSVCENTAICLSNLAAASDDSRAALVQLDVVPMLRRFVDDSDSTTSGATQQFAILTLCSLVTYSAASTALVQCKLFASIANLAVRTSHDRVRDLCANALSNASSDTSYHPALLQDDTLGTIVRLCKCKKDVDDDNGTSVSFTPVTPASSGPPTVLMKYQESALACLFNLSFAVTSRALLVRADIITTLVRVFTKPPVKADEALRQCAAILANLSFDASARMRLMADHGVRLLRRLISAATASTTATSDVPVTAAELGSVRETLRCCATACCNLAVDALEKTPVLDMLIDLSASSYGPTILTCAIALAKLTGKATHRSVLTRCAEVYPALTLMMRCGVEEIQIYSAVALCNLAMDAPIAKPLGVRAVWKEGTVPDFIVNALLRINSDSTKAICASALFNLLTHDDVRALHIKDGVLYALVKLARLESVEIRTLCVTALYNLSCEPALMETLMDLKIAQVIPKLCEMAFQSFVNYQKLAACLTNLAFASTGTNASHGSTTASIAVRLVESGALGALLILCEHDDLLTRHACAATLCYLSAYKVNCEAMATLGLVDVLTSKLLSRVEAIDTVRELQQRQLNEFALNALCNLSCYPALHDRLVDARAVPQIIQLLASNANQADEAMMLVCVQTLANLTYHARHRRAVLTHGVIRSLLDCAPTLRCSSRVSDVCAAIIAVLCEDPLHWPELIAAGAVRVLRELIPDGTTAAVASHAALRAAIYALSQLARCEKGGETVLADGALDVVAYVLGLDEEGGARQEATEARCELAERCAIIIRALSTQGEAVSLVLMRNQRLVPLVLAIVQTCALGPRQLQTSKHVILAFYNLTSCPLTVDDVQETADTTEASVHGLDAMVMNGVVPLLIRLSRDGGSDMAPACAVALAHVKHRIKERLAMSQGQEHDRSPQRELRAMDELMEAGVVTALLAMFELDSHGIQRVDRLAATMPPVVPVLCAATEQAWVFLASTAVLRFDTALPVCWDCCNCTLDDARFVPAEPRSFLPPLPPIVPASGATLQDKVYGRVQILHVRRDKCRLRLEDSRFAKLATALMGPADAPRGSPDLSHAIATAMGTKSEQETTANEIRVASFVKKKLTSRAVMARAASNRGHAVFGLSPRSDSLYSRRVSSYATAKHPTRKGLSLGPFSTRKSVHHRLNTSGLLPKIS